MSTNFMITKLPLNSMVAPSNNKNLYFFRPSNSRLYRRADSFEDILTVTHNLQVGLLHFTINKIPFLFFLLWVSGYRKWLYNHRILKARFYPFDVLYYQDSLSREKFLEDKLCQVIHMVTSLEERRETNSRPLTIGDYAIRNAYLIQFAI